MAKTDTEKKVWDAQAELNRFAPLEEAIEAQSEGWTTLTERAQGQITDALEGLKDDTQEDAYRKADGCAAQLSSCLKKGARHCFQILYGLRSGHRLLAFNSGSVYFGV